MMNHAVRVNVRGDTCQNIKTDSIGTLFRYANRAYPKDTDITYTGVIE